MRNLIFLSVAIFYFTLASAQEKPISPKEFFVTQEFKEDRLTASATGLKHFIIKDSYGPYGLYAFLFANVSYKNGDTYTGFLLRSRKNGYGIFKKNNGAITEGLWDNDTLVKEYKTGISEKIINSPNKEFSKKTISFMNEKHDGYYCKVNNDAGDILFISKRSKDIFLYFGQLKNDQPDGNGHFTWVDGPDRSNYVGYDTYSGSGFFENGELAKGIFSKMPGSLGEGFSKEQKSIGSFMKLALQGFGINYPYPNVKEVGNFISKVFVYNNIPGKVNYTTYVGFCKVFTDYVSSKTIRLESSDYYTNASFPYNDLSDSLKFAEQELQKIKNNDQIGITISDLTGWFTQKVNSKIAWLNEKKIRDAKEAELEKQKVLALQQEKERKAKEEQQRLANRTPEQKRKDSLAAIANQNKSKYDAMVGRVYNISQYYGKDESVNFYVTHHDGQYFYGITVFGYGQGVTDKGGTFRLFHNSGKKCYYEKQTVNHPQFTSSRSYTCDPKVKICSSCSGTGNSTSIYDKIVYRTRADMLGNYTETTYTIYRKCGACDGKGLFNGDY